MSSFKDEVNNSAAPRPKVSKLGYAIILFLFLGVSTWIYLRYFKQSWEHGATRITTQYSLNAQMYPEEYEVQLPDDGWYDTGIWINAYSEVVVISKNNPMQPFMMQIGWNKRDAQLQDGGTFATHIILATLKDENKHVIDAGYIKGQEKLWLKMDKDSIADKMTLRILIRPYSIN